MYLVPWNGEEANVTTTIKRADELKAGDTFVFQGWARLGWFRVVRILPPAGSRISFLIGLPGGEECARFFHPGEPVEVLTP